MEKILDEIKMAEKGSDIYSLIEEVVRKVHEKEPNNTDKDNWFEAQRRINRFLIEDKLAERILSTYPEKDYDSCLEEARKTLNKVDLDNEYLNNIVYEGISPESIIKCNLKYYSNQFYLHRKNQTDSSSLEKKFEDWKKSLDCVADNISLY